MHVVKFSFLNIIAVLVFPSAVFASAPGKLVLIMDDLGNQYAAGVEAVSIPWVTTVAIMPARPFTQALAELAYQQHKEVIIHAPMSNSIDFPLGPLGLNRDQGKTQMVENIRQSILGVPHAVGLSNHMGSRLTQDGQAMRWLMAELKAHRLFFFDSRTVSTTKGWQAANTARVPWAMRDIFLDHFREPEFMKSQWQDAEARVLSGENVTVICHPYPETLDFLANLTLSQTIQNSLVPVSKVLIFPKDKKIDFNLRNMPE